MNTYISRVIHLGTAESSRTEVVLVLKNIINMVNYKKLCTLLFLSLCICSAKILLSYCRLPFALKKKTWHRVIYVDILSLFNSMGTSFDGSPLKCYLAKGA